MKAWAIVSMCLAGLFGLCALGTGTVSGAVANMHGEHQQLIFTLLFGFFLVCGFVAVAAEMIVSAITQR